jgi:hypothetical protein
MFDYEAGIDKLYKDGMLFTNAVMLTSHNSFASLEDGWTVHPIQQYDYIHQFYYGVRGFMIDVYKEHDELVLLHNSDFKGYAGISSSVTKTFFLEDFLRGIKNLLDKHEKSVITIIIENVGVSQKEISTSIKKVNLEDYLLLKNPNDKSLTFGEMRKNNQRLLMLAENGHKTENGIYSTSYYKETTYALEDDQSCIDRNENRVPFADPKVKVFILNHFFKKSCASPAESFYGISSIINAAKVTCSNANDYNQIIERANSCLKINNKPVFIAVDFIEQGNNGGALKAVSDLVDKSFYKKNLLYSNNRPKQYSYKIDSGNMFSLAIGGVLGTIVGISFTLVCLHYRNRPHHID